MNKFQSPLSTTKPYRQLWLLRMPLFNPLRVHCPMCTTLIQSNHVASARIKVPKWCFTLKPLWPPQTPTESFSPSQNKSPKVKLYFEAPLFIPCMLHTHLHVQALNIQSFHSILPKPPQLPFFFVPSTSDMYIFLFLKNLFHVSKPLHPSHIYSCYYPPFLLPYHFTFYQSSSRHILSFDICSFLFKAHGSHPYNTKATTIPSNIHNHPHWQ